MWAAQTRPAFFKKEHTKWVCREGGQGPGKGWKRKVKRIQNSQRTNFCKKRGERSNSSFCLCQVRTDRGLHARHTALLSRTGQHLGLGFQSLSFQNTVRNKDTAYTTHLPQTGTAPGDWTPEVHFTAGQMTAIYGADYPYPSLSTTAFQGSL